MVQTLKAFCNLGFFGEELEKAFVGRKEKVNGKEAYRRMILIRSKKDYYYKQDDSAIYVLDSESLSLSESSHQEIIDRMQDGTYIYERDYYKLKGIGVEQKE